MARIMGAPAGGTPQATDTVSMAPKTPYSQELADTTPATSLTIGNTPFDPYAEQAAQLEAMKAETAAINAKLAGGTAGTPASTTPQWATQYETGTPESAKSPYMIERDPVTGAYRAKAWDQDQRGLLDVTAQTLASDPALRRTMEWGLGNYTTAGKVNPAHLQYANELTSLFGTAGVPTSGAFTGYQRPAGYNTGAAYAQGGYTAGPIQLNTVPAGSSGAGTAPVNPGPRAPWQQSAQYWRDLDAWKKAGGV